MLGSLRGSLGNGRSFSMARMACWEAGQSITGRDISHRCFPAGDAAAGAFYRQGHAGGKYLIDEKMKRRARVTAPSAVPAGGKQGKS